MLGPIVIDLEGLQLTTEEKQLLKHPNLGGIILFSRNYHCPEQLANLVNEIRHQREDCLISVDQEGGRVQRFKAHFSKLPNLRLLGRLLDDELLTLPQLEFMAEKLGFLMALEVRAFGVDLSFAPVLDLDTGISEVIGNRAFHSKPNVVAVLAQSYIQGMKGAQMSATGKHFPGHGSISSDSHHELPVDNRTYEQITNDLFPFKQLIKSGIQAIMPGHILFPKIDDVPVGFSKFWLQNILRKELNFQGIIISDDLSMFGAKIVGDMPTRAQKALDAGCDIVLICNDRKGAIEALENIKIENCEYFNKRILKFLANRPRINWQNLPTMNEWCQSVQVLKKFEGNVAKLNPQVA